jgi:DNA-binding NarL/FixJ family response regulator
MGIRLGIACVRGIVREGLCSFFLTQNDVELVGEADDAAGLVELIEKSSPQILIVSDELAGIGAEEAARRVLAINSAIRVIGLSEDLNIHNIRAFLAAGGAGFITIANGFSEFIRAVRAVATMRIYMSPDVADAMVANYVLGPPADQSGTTEKALSAREREVLQHVAEGMSTKDTAAALQISTKTVDMHRQRIMNKLKIRSVAQLTKYAIRKGIAELQ